MAAKKIFEVRDFYDERIDCDAPSLGGTTMMLIDEEYHFAATRRSQLVGALNKLRRDMGKYWSEKMHDRHPTMMMFKVARMLNIDIDCERPQSVEAATKGCNFGYSYIKSDPSAARQMQVEWEEYLADLVSGDIEPLAADANKYKNGERLLNYWESKKECWPILAVMACRILFMIIGSMDVERFFSVYQRYMADIDAGNIRVNKKERALCVLNRHHL